MGGDAITFFWAPSGVHKEGLFLFFFFFFGEHVHLAASLLN